MTASFRPKTGHSFDVGVEVVNYRKSFTGEPLIEPNSVKKLKTVVVYVAGAPTGPTFVGHEMGLLLGAIDLTGLSQFIDAPEVRQAADGFILSSMRNQLTVTVRQNRLDFDDGSAEVPVRTDFSDRASRIAEYIGKQSNLSYAAVGLNFDIEVEPEDEELPSKVLLNRLVREDALGDTGYDIMGASARFWYAARNRRCDLRIEPRENRYEGRNYLAHLNVHIELGGEMPSAEWLSQALDQEYRDFIRVLTEILKPRGRH